jgi:putative ABC transport system permease protein
LTLALGIGANTAIFSVVNAVLLKPLPYRDPGRIVTILTGGRGPVAAGDFLDYRAQSRSFESMAAAEWWGGTLGGGDRPEEVFGIHFGEEMFQLLGVPPLLGRTFQADDFKPGGEQHILVLAYSLWQRRFGGSTSIIGQSVILSGERFTVVGVMPSGFKFAPFWATKAELAAPLDLAGRSTARGSNSLRVFARLKPDFSLAAAQVEMDAICKRLELAYPDSNTGRTVRVDPLAEKVVGDVRRGLLVLGGAVVFVLLIACANVANLLLARAAARQKEMAIRAALGARRWRAIRQLLTESIVLAVISGCFGLLFGVLGVAGIKGWLPRLPRGAEVAVDSTALVFTLGVSLLTGLVFGLAPALLSARSGLQGGLKESGRGVTEGRGGRRLQSGLVVAEIALALITLTGAGLMLRSFARLTAVNPGFDSQNVVSFVVSLNGQPDMVGGKREAFYRQVVEQVGALPGVVSASAINHLPLAGDLWDRSLAIEGRPPLKPGEGISPVYRVCRPAYFQTMGIAIAKGRDFSGRDTPESPPVIIINERMARQYWPGEDPVGRRVALDDSTANPPAWRTIVGVIKDVKQRSWTDAADDEVYIPFSQSPYYGDAQAGGMHYASMTLVVRARADAAGIVPAVDEVVRSLNRNAAVSSVATMEQVVSNALAQPRLNFILIGLFALLALVLGAVGIYGVMAYAVSRRIHEIGIRMAMGAGRGAVLSLVVGHGMRLAFFGVAAGLAGACLAARAMRTLLFEVSPFDPLVFAVVSALLVAVAVLACLFPALRAARVDPMSALRNE